MVVYQNGLEKIYRSQTESTIYKPSSLTTPIDPSIIIGFEELNENIGKVTIIDARSPDEFDGTTPRAARGGHIPTAKNIDWNNNLDDSGKLKSDEELRISISNRQGD